MSLICRFRTKDLFSKIPYKHIEFLFKNAKIFEKIGIFGLFYRFEPKYSTFNAIAYIFSSDILTTYFLNLKIAKIPVERLANLLIFLNQKWTIF